MRLDKGLLRNFIRLGGPNFEKFGQHLPKWKRYIGRKAYVRM